MKSTNVSQAIRDQLKVNQMTPAEIGAALGITTERAYQHLRDMIPGAYICKMGDGTYMWLKDPKKAMSQEEKEEKRRERNIKRRVARQLNPTVSAPHRVKSAGPKKAEAAFVPGETVDEWIKAGGVIDRSPMTNKFKRLTAEDIDRNRRGPSPFWKIKVSRAYLVG